MTGISPDKTIVRNQSTLCFLEIPTLTLTSISPSVNRPIVSRDNVHQHHEAIETESHCDFPGHDKPTSPKIQIPLGQCSVGGCKLLFQARMLHYYKKSVPHLDDFKPFKKHIEEDHIKYLESDSRGKLPLGQRTCIFPYCSKRVQTKGEMSSHLYRVHLQENTIYPI